MHRLYHADELPPPWRPGPVAAPYVFIAVNIAIGGIALGTLWLLLRGRLLPPPLVPPAATAPLQVAPRVL